MSSSGPADSKKRGKKSKNMDGTTETLTKEEMQIAKYLRLKCPNKKGNLQGMKVDFFIGNKLVDCLMESEWGPGKQGQKKNNKQPLLSNRQACIALMQNLMNKQLFHPAIKVYKDQVESNKNESPDETPSIRKRKTNDDPKSTPGSKENAQKRKFKLEISDDKRFIDANEPYVWVFDPTTTKTYVIGSLLILGSIGICLFPLWPSVVREGVYYVSLAGASFLGGILGLAVFKYILFAFIWLCTLGSVHFWLFPNLTEDVGFFESFVPVYKCQNLSSNKSADEKSRPDETNRETIEDERSVRSEEKETKSKSVPSTPKPKTTEKEMSKSDVETNLNESPIVKRKTSTREDDDYDLIDDDDLEKN
ncbi:translocation SEC62 [Brachionus plicatilis]|uniref:Translocation protein SEC62 n=1 Tax=Brachionus plicatilis TaxID=10195 RepID=A0A3M7QCE3_BRAPC|nr:translocation SEC62 [Brachionus plicatilis]